MSSQGKKYSSLFLDRDGVINYKINGYVESFDTFKFIPGSIDAICNLRVLFNYIIIITNQQGIGKGIMNEEDLLLLHTEMINNIESLGGYIDNIYFCPHLESSNCDCRKPNPGMLNSIVKDWNIDKDRCLFIGDKTSDKIAAESAEINFEHVNKERGWSKINFNI